jgi:glycosyltransferase involved in cell wall biosynthesis
MKILVFAHRLEVGGTQTNAIELSAALRDLHGHDVVFFATPGPMLKLVSDKRLRFLPAPDARFHPSLARMRALREAVRRERPDMVHVWDWWQAVEAYYAVHVPMQVPMVVTDMMMNFTRLLPKRVPTTFGTPELFEHARAHGRKRVQIILPPVDTSLNAPDAVDSAPFRQQYGIADTDITVVIVSRLSEWMKGESLFRTLDAIRILAHDLPLRLVIVGDGVLYAKIKCRADEINASLKRPVVIMTGALLDPRPAYAAADIVVGMGGAALRGMAFGKAVIIVGEQGFSAPLNPDTAESFYYKGIYGRGDGDIGNLRLTADIRELAEQPDRLLELGLFSREFVLQHFSLKTVAARLEEFCRNAATDEPPRFHVTAADGIRTAAVYLRERRFWCPSKSPTPN